MRFAPWYTHLPDSSQPPTRSLRRASLSLPPSAPSPPSCTYGAFACTHSVVSLVFFSVLVVRSCCSLCVRSALVPVRTQRACESVGAFAATRRCHHAFVIRGAPSFPHYRCSAFLYLAVMLACPWDVADCASGMSALLALHICRCLPGGKGREIRPIRPPRGTARSKQLAPEPAAASSRAGSS